MTELDKLEAYLKDKGIPYKREDHGPAFLSAGVTAPDFHQIIVYDKDGNRLWDAISHYGSYGFRQGLIEIMGDTVVDPRKDRDTVVGWLTADDVIRRIEGKDDWTL